MKNRGLKKHIELDIALGKLCWTTRKVLKISQNHMGQILNLHQTAVHRVEIGHQSLSAVEYLTLLPLIECMQKAVKAYKASKKQDKRLAKIVCDERFKDHL